MLPHLSIIKHTWGMYYLCARVRTALCFVKFLLHIAHEENKELNVILMFITLKTALFISRYRIMQHLAGNVSPITKVLWQIQSGHARTEPNYIYNIAMVLRSEDGCLLGC